MSTLNRALAKIYGQSGAQSCSPEVPADADCQTVECQTADCQADGQHDAVETASQDCSKVEAVDLFGGDSLSDFESPSVIELLASSIRFDGPSSHVVEPPHLELADVRSDELPQPPTAEAATVEAKPVADKPAPETSSDETAYSQHESDGHLLQSATDPAGKAVEPAITPPIQSVTAAQTLSPEWEVDRFRWPETCQRLLLEKDEAFELAIQSLQDVRPAGQLIVALVGEKSGAGSTTTALCIARQAAQSGKNVLLVDADVSSPKLATSVGLNTPCSWHDSICGDVPLAESMVVSVEDRLSLMPLHADCQQSSLMLSDEKVADVLREAAVANDLVILDCGSIERVAQRVAEEGRLPCDVAVVVHDASGHQESDAAKLADALQSLGVENFLLAENFVREPKPADEELQSSAA